MTISRPAMRYHGGKFRLAAWVMRFFPPHRIYTEAFGGAAGVLLQKPRSHGEIYNDLDDNVVAVFRCLQQPELRGQLVQACTLTPYARAEFNLAWEHTDDLVERARRTLIRAQMGFGSAGAVKGSTGLRTDTMRQYTTAQMDWAAYPPILLDVAERFQQVLIENRAAVDVLRDHDSAQTLHFVDPPYVHSTRELRSRGGVSPRTDRRGSRRAAPGALRPRRHGGAQRLRVRPLCRCTEGLGCPPHAVAYQRGTWGGCAHRDCLDQPRLPRGAGQRCGWSVC